VRTPKYSLTAVVVQDALGSPRAFPVVVLKSGGKVSSAKIVLTFEERIALDGAAKSSGVPEGKDGLAWCAGISTIRDRRYEGGQQIAVESANYFNNCETQAVDVDSIVGRFPENATEGEQGNEKPVNGLCWGDVVLIRAVRAAHNLRGKNG